MKLTRRTVLSRVSIVAGGVIASPAILHWPAYAAEFAYKCGTALPDGHPMVIRGREAAAKIKQDSGGRLDITFYTNSVLGQDTAMISQTIAGALEMYCLPIDLLAPKNAACGVCGVGFAFDGYAHAWQAMDGELGNYLREIAKGIGFHCLDKTPDHGFRQNDRAIPSAEFRCAGHRGHDRRSEGLHATVHGHRAPVPHGRHGTARIRVPRKRKRSVAPGRQVNGGLTSRCACCMTHSNRDDEPIPLRRETATMCWDSVPI